MKIEIAIRNAEEYVYVDEQGNPTIYPRTVKTATEVELKGETEDEIFRKFEKLQKQYKYCNSTYYSWKYEETRTKHCAWYASLSEKEKFAIYYGGGIVD